MPAKIYKYERVLAYLDNILLPALEPGMLLPDTEQLCRELDCSLITLNHALAILSRRGRIKRIRNKGTVVLAPALREKPLPKRRLVRVLGIAPGMWNFMRAMETALTRYRDCHEELEFRFEYPQVDEWFDRIRDHDYDLIFGNTDAIRLIMNSPELRGRVMILEQLRKLEFSREDFPDNLIGFCSELNHWRAVPLTAAPVFQLTNPRHPEIDPARLPDSLPEFLDYLRRRQRGGRPMLAIRMALSYIETFFRARKLSLFSLDGTRCLIDTPEAQHLLEQLSGFITRDKLLFPITTQIESRFFAHNNVLENILDENLAIRWASGLDFYPGNEIKYHITPPPGALHTPGTHLFLEGVMAGINSDPDLVTPILNYLQSIAVQNLLVGCAGVPARQDMRTLLLARLEPAYPGITRTVHATLPHATPVRCGSPTASTVLLEYIQAILGGLLSVPEGCRQAMRRIETEFKLRNR